MSQQLDLTLSEMETLQYSLDIRREQLESTNRKYLGVNTIRAAGVRVLCAQELTGVCELQARLTDAIAKEDV